MKAIWGVLALFAVVLSGCASTATPSTLATPSGKAPAARATTPSPSPTADLQEDVLAFIDRYMAAAEDSIRSRDALAQRRELFSTECLACEEGAAVAEGILDTGLQAEGGEITWSGEVEVAGPESAVVTVTRSLGQVQLRDASGSVQQTIPASPEVVEVYQLGRQNGGWVVLAISRLT
jgi:hypothetical protein